MRCFAFFFLVWTSFAVHAQLKFNYQNENLNIPDWLTNPNYITENEDEETNISIEEEVLDNINGFSIVKIRMNENMFNHSTSEIYLGTFNNNNNITDIIYVASHSATDWNWTSEAYFEQIMPGIYKYFFIDLNYRSAENDEEQASYGGMILSSTDSTIEYFKINPDGTIFSSDNIESFQEFDSENNEESFDEDACIVQIRSLFNEINKNSDSYQKVFKTIDPDISLTLFTDEQSIRKIIAYYKKEKLTEEYYFDNDILIFAFSVNKTSKEENRYYFYHETLFRWLKGIEKSMVDKKNAAFSEKETDLLKKIEKFKER